MTHSSTAFADGEGSELLVGLVVAFLATIGLGGALLCISVQTLFALALFEVTSRLRAARYRVSDTVLPRSTSLLDFCWLLSAPFGVALLASAVLTVPDRMTDAFDRAPWVHAVMLAMPAFIAIVGASTSRMIRGRAQRRANANGGQAYQSRPQLGALSFLCFLLMMIQFAAGAFMVARPEFVPETRAAIAARAKARADAIEAAKAEKALNADVKKMAQSRATEAAELKRHISSNTTQDDQRLQNGGQTQAPVPKLSSASAAKVPLSPEAQAAADRVDAAQRTQCAFYGVFEVDKGNQTYWYTLRDNSTFERMNVTNNERTRGSWRFDPEKLTVYFSYSGASLQTETERVALAGSRGLVTSVDTTTYQYKLVSIVDASGCDTTERLADLARKRQ